VNGDREPVHNDACRSAATATDGGDVHRGPTATDHHVSSRGRHRSTTDRSRRQNAVVLVVATTLGLWWGMSAPAVSPAAPPAPPVAAAAELDQHAAPPGAQP
jgi:hypothetical protein